ncbi:MAG: PQQ-binding-like beta-propeller repeat protein [Candidatus Eremiobacteraeota bacterium]|nr:PQQ-binding-like beta-propeller repeat protein [Candidatus Eremiobacteraeota bacterium]
MCSYLPIRILFSTIAAGAILLAGCSGHGSGLVPPAVNKAGSARLKPAGASGSFEQLVLQSNPTQYFELEETGCCMASNIGSSGVSGTYTSSNVTYSLAGPAQGETSTAIGLPGNTSSTATSMGVSIPNPSTSGAFSVEDWVYPVFTTTSKSVNLYYTIWGYNTSHRLLINNQSTAQGQLLTQFGGINFRSTGKLTANAWNQVVFVYDGAKEYFYINGALDSSQAVHGVSLVSAYWLGQYDTGLYYKLDGRVGQHMVFPAALSASVIQSHYAAATSPSPTPTSSPTKSPQLVQQVSNSQVAPSTIAVQFGNTPTAGDALLVFFHNNGNSSGGGNTYTPPVGWTQIDVDTSVPSQTYQAFYHIAGASEPNTYSFTPACACNQHVWNALEVSGVNATSPIDQHGFGFPNQTTSWNTPTETPSQTNDLAVVAMLPTASSQTWTNAAGWTVDAPAASTWSGEVLQETLTTTSPVSEASTLSSSSSGYAAIVLLVPGGASGPTPSPTPIPTSTPGTAYSDWSTFGDNVQRTGYNRNETILNATNVSNGLKLAWTSADLGGAITAQPILATNVSINGTPTNVLYVGAENDVFYAINADTGAVIWQNSTLGTPVNVRCGDLPGGQFGITGTATYDKNAGIVYVADASGYVHALSMTSGVEQWNTNALYDPNTGAVVGAPNQDHIYGALTFNPVNGMIYTYTAGLCDAPPWHGRIVAISTATHNVAAAFFPGRTGNGQTGTVYCGGGIWGMGGASVDPITNNVLVATGNVESATTGGCITDSQGETYPYGDAVVELDQNLNLLSFQTATINGAKISGDSDYGATAMLYQTGCAFEQASAKNKDGYVYTYGENSGLTFEQQVQLAPKTSAGQFVGVPAFDPTSGIVYIGNPVQVGHFAHGLNAFTTSGCSGLTLLWSDSIGTANATGQDNQAPTVANGVVFFTDGIDNQLWAFNAANGTVLWHSGTAIGSPCGSYGTACGVYAAPTVDQRVYVSSFNHRVYAFTL